MSKNTERAGSGIGFLGALFLVLMVLKTTGQIHASWLWVSAPLWGPLALAAAILVVGLGGLGIWALGSHMMFLRAARRARKAAAK